jgi:hypothetical protein
MSFDLGRADPRVKWLVTCLLATFGLAYLFGALMVSMYAGFTPARVAATYAPPEAAMTMQMPPESTMVVEHPMAMTDFAAGDTAGTHFVDRKLLIQDTHIHVPMYGVIAASLSVIVMGLGLSRAWGFTLITLLFAAPWLDFAGMWLTKLVSANFAVVTIAGGWAMGFGYTIVAVLAMRRMWFIRTERSTS